jgi:hypothetical protein
LYLLEGLEVFHPRSKFNFSCPSTSGLAQNVQISQGDRIRVKQAISIISRILAFWRSDCTVDDEMSQMNVFGSQFAGDTLNLKDEV